MNAIHILAPDVQAKRIVTCVCLDCRKRTRLLGFFQDYYGWRDTCLRCGRSWDDGEWLPLPFVRGSRQGEIGRAKERWRNTFAESTYLISAAPNPNTGQDMAGKGE